ncbi:radical SAM protein [Candidatus Bathyarchaeota archaeon]|nr:radical SAM protein [Candidatus Bathyarchaeota archaeon]
MKTDKIRVSIGSAIVLGLIKGMITAEPTTAYLLTYTEGRCSANCAFCPQARKSTARADMLSRVMWPDFKFTNVIEGIRKSFESGRIKRVCIQTLNYPGVQNDIINLAAKISSECNIPISISCQPLAPKEMTMLAKVGVERISIALDAVTKEIFSKIKGEMAGGPYNWDQHFGALKAALEIFGRGKVTTHLIVGLGESEEEFISMVQRCVDAGIFPAVFAFTPIQGTKMANHPKPPIESYRRIQVAHYLIVREIRRYEDMKFKDGQLINFGVSSNELERIIFSGEPFLTSGCPNCNRPYYNEEPKGPIYNYPRKLTQEEIESIWKQMSMVL